MFGFFSNLRLLQHFPRRLFNFRRVDLRVDLRSSVARKRGPYKTQTNAHCRAAACGVPLGLATVSDHRVQFPWWSSGLRLGVGILFVASLLGGGSVVYGDTETEQAKDLPDVEEANAATDESKEEEEEEERPLDPHAEAFWAGELHPIEVYDPDPPDRPLPEFWFPVGEEIHYRVYWGRIPVGTAVIHSEWVEKYGRTMLAIQLRTRSNRFLDRIYRVDDVTESIVDPHTFLPVRFTKNWRQGRYRAHEVTKFDYANNIAYWRSLTRDRTDTFELEPDTRCLVSFAYYMRKVGFTEGERRHFRVMADEKVYDLWMEARDNERIRLPNYGRVSSIEVEPEAAFDGLFVRRGRVIFWVSNDERRVLTQMEGEIPVASIRLILDEVKGPGDDDWVKKETD